MATSGQTAPFNLTDAINAIRALSSLHNTSSSRDEDLALDAFQADRAAFWTTEGASNQLAGILLEAANRDGLTAALARCANDLHPQFMRHTTFLLSTLIPLNQKARVALNGAWERLADDDRAMRIARASHPVPMFEAAE